MSIIYKTHTGYSAQTISGITVLVPISDSCPKFNGMMKLTGIGSFLWELFKDGSTIELACEKVTEEYDVQYDKAYSDISLFVSSLLENGLLTEEKI